MTWLRLHLNALAEALRRIAGQPVASALSILVLATAIALPVVAAVALRSLGAATSGLDTDPHVNVYLGLDASDEDVKRVEQALKSNAAAASVRFISRQQALAELKATTHLAEILATLDRNPLPHAFTVRVRTTDSERIGQLRADWSALPKVDQVLADFEWSERLGRWVRFGNRALLAAWILLGTAVAFVVGHLIRLQVLTHREEIEVSQLVGATAADVRRPFLYHGAVQGLLAGAAAVGMAVALAGWAGYEMRALAPSYASELKVVFLSLVESGGVALATAALGLCGAWIAVSRELRRFSAPG
ncbi:MAG: ABC transporter permease [Pseudomonadota bacterium]|nr:ABC transporter permease [Pseudomonadota bacterium]